MSQASHQHGMQKSQASPERDTSTAADDGLCGICWLPFEQCDCSPLVLRERAAALSRAAKAYLIRADIAAKSRREKPCSA
jgi:hypothetical protein